MRSLSVVLKLSPSDGDAIHERTVAATEVRYNESVAVFFNHRMAARNRSVPNLESRSGLPANQHRTFVHRDDGVIELTGDGGNSWLHRFMGAKEIIGQHSVRASESARKNYC